MQKPTLPLTQALRVRLRFSNSIALLRRKLKLKAAARRKLQLGQISYDIYTEVRKVLNAAQPRDFAPVLYLIARDQVRDQRFGRVPPSKAANLSSIEYTIDGLRDYEFEIITTQLRLTNSL